MPLTVLVGDVDVVDDAGSCINPYGIDWPPDLVAPRQLDNTFGHRVTAAVSVRLMLANL